MTKKAKNLTPKDTRILVLSARYFVDSFYHCGRENRPDVSQHLQLIIKNGLVNKFKYVSLHRPKSEEAQYSPGNLESVDIVYFFAHDLTFEEFKSCRQLYDSCRSWSRTPEDMEQVLLDSYKAYIDPKNIPTPKALWYFKSDVTGRATPFNLEDYRLWTHKFMQESIDVHGFNDE